MATRALTRREYMADRKLDRRAFKLQAKEYERRLKTLNGEHKTNIENWRTSVRQETFDSYKGRTDVRIGELEQREHERVGRSSLFRGLAAAGALGLVLQFLQLIGWIPR